MISDCKRFRVLALAIGLVLAQALPAAAAENLGLSGAGSWVAVAVSKDKDEAIGIARLYEARKARVATLKSGGFAVFFGPVKPASIGKFRKTYQDWPDLPTDARLSHGEDFTATAWQPEDIGKAIDVTAAKPVQLAQGGFAVTAALVADGGNTSIKLAGTSGSQTLFNLETAKDEFADFGSSVTIARLDPAAALPQVMVVRNTGGAHCCAATSIASSKGPGGWMLVDGGKLDGDGYRLEDLDGDGAAELVNYDNSFFYAFDSYAASFAPIRIKRLSRDKLKDVTAEPQWRPRLAQDLAGMEFLARMDPKLWHSNGYLAAWVATEIELGQGEMAWKRMLKSYDRHSDFNPQVCTTGQSVDDCPEGKLQQVPFPEGLAAHIKEHGYGEAPGG